jgi:hypothetical protein
VTLACLIKFIIKESFNLDLAFLKDFLLVYVPAGVIPGALVLFMNGPGPSESGPSGSGPSGSGPSESGPSGSGPSGSGTGHGSGNNVDSDEEDLAITEEEERQRLGSQRTDDKKLSGLYGFLWDKFEKESQVDELLEKRAAKENELHRIEVHKNVANRIDKDYSKDGMFDEQKEQATRELDKINRSIQRRKGKINRIAHHVNKEMG